MSLLRTPSKTVRVFRGEDLIVRLKLILGVMDLAAEYAERGDHRMHEVNRLARAELQTLIAEVSE